MATDAATITDGEMRILKAIFANMNTKPDVDWDAAASAASLGNAKSLKERYRQMCIRLGWNKKSEGGGSSAPATTKKASPAKASPAKVTKRTAKAKKTAPKVREEDEDEGGNIQEGGGGDGGAAAGGKKGLAAHVQDGDDEM